MQIKDLRDAAALDEMIMNGAEPIMVIKNGYDRFTCVRSSDFRRWESADARAALRERIMVSERELAQGLSSDAFESLSKLREKRGL